MSGCLVASTPVNHDSPASNPNSPLASTSTEEAGALPPALLSPGTIVSLACAVALCEGETAPPPYLSEAELLDLMERHGVGTDASMASHIKNVCERGYVGVAAGGGEFGDYLSSCL